jgi:aminoglycoside 6'-N-acetyltransferase
VAPRADDHQGSELDIVFERLAREHFALLGRWLAEPHVARWWDHDPSPAAVEDDFGDTVDGLEPAEDFLVVIDGEPAGIVQYCRYHDYPEYVEEMASVYPVSTDVASIDYFIGDPQRVGRGLGTAMIAAFVDRVWVSEPDVSAIVVPVNSANVASWRALLSAGFRLVARGDLVPDNPIDDPAHEILRIDRPRPVRR